MNLKITLCLSLMLLVMGARAEEGACSDQEVWVVVVNAVGPAVGIIASLSCFCFVRCCTQRNKKYFLKFLRCVSLANWFIFLISMVLLILSCEHVAIELFDGFEVTERVYGLTMFVSWLVMMIESYLSRERWYIKHLGKKRAVLQRIGTLRNTPPQVIWSVVGYNYESREVPVCGAKLQCPTPVVKFPDTEEYEYKYWVDHSAPKVTGGGKSVITRIKLNHEVQAGDVETRKDMRTKKQEWKNSFRERNEVHVDFLEEDAIQGFEKRMAVDESMNGCLRIKQSLAGCRGCECVRQCCEECDGCANCCLCIRECCTPWVIGKAQFWIASFLSLTWPYRWLFKCLTDKTRYTISKKFYINQPQLNGDYTVRSYGEIIKGSGGVEMEEEDVEKGEEIGETSGVEVAAPATAAQSDTRV